MNKVTVFKLYVSDQEGAKRFYVDQLVRAPDNREVSINLEIAKTNEQKALVGRQGAGEPLFAISTDDCKRDYVELKRRGNKIYLNQDPV